MRVFHCHHALRTYLDSLEGTAALVPTMGALHEGHLSLIDVAKQHADYVVASVFVNPLQFSPREDFAAYPRNNETDSAMLKDKGVEALYLPSADEMYDPQSVVRIDPGRPGQELEGIYRPHFFQGVLTVVAKLFARVRPDAAIFGEKDYQQLLMIRNMVRDLDMHVNIIGAPIIRDKTTQLALSSRNRYLAADELRVSAIFPQLLSRTADIISDMRKKGDIRYRDDLRPVIDTMKQGLRDHGIMHVDYIEARNADTLLKPSDYAQESMRLLAAIRYKGVRLLDNMPC